MPFVRVEHNRLIAVRLFCHVWGAAVCMKFTYLVNGGRQTDQLVTACTVCHCRMEPM